MKKLFITVIVILLCCFLNGPANADDQAVADNQAHGIQRFGRGVVNLLSSPLELPAQMYVRARYWDERSDNPFKVMGGFFEGIPMGFVYCGWRFAAGIYDIATFPFWCYDESIIDPEYISFSPKFLEKEEN
jgi:putative exosortase-associated protein (TIGR04073 family)